MSRSSRVGRADAARNRDLLLTAARVSVAEAGADVPLRVIAQRAGLSSASLYRHFPSRAHLLASVYEAETERCRQLLDDALAAEDAFAGLLQALRVFAALEQDSPGFTVTLVEPAPGTTRTSADASAAMADLRDLVDRARRRPEVRNDLTLDDVGLVIASIRTVAALDPVRAPARCARVIELFRRAMTT
ncbi:TetR/AcrR family transcriptional regulator [Microbacterium marinilacus]|uniref:TetR/AcrR family transcriptional regulator n=1 Tax=Microbacterium marinilacus TaxID=415209 RepID=UPI0027E18C8B|nr:TetR family transcriptional regulator [Microbacterium marinilacus]